ncbi:MAG TPA: UMP kinase [Gemmatales bacterium]|nr:UMP kinase [Gemmatales bacterium]
MPSDDPSQPRYQRVLLKLSGESFGSAGKGGISLTETQSVAQQIKRVVSATGVQLTIVVGGGNILRGSQFAFKGGPIPERTAHYMGMLATMMNGMALREVLEKEGCPARLMTALRADQVAEPYYVLRCIRHLEKGRVVILAGGTGNPFVTTDTAAATRAREVEAQIMLKATKVDGVYSADPEKNPHAVLYERLTYDKAIKDGLGVIDVSALDSAAKADPPLPIIVFNFKREGNIERAIRGQRVGTLISHQA